MTGMQYANEHPLTLPRSAHLSRLLVRNVHQHNHHAGPGTVQTIMSRTYCIPCVVKGITRKCVTCRRIYARTATQVMAPLPSGRVTPSQPFSKTGLDFVGPLIIKRGNPRKPSKVKCYVCVFVCFCTKAVHLELVTDLTTNAFLAAFRRFSSCRGYPTTVYTDNGTNFVGATAELQRVREFLRQKDMQAAIQNQSSETGVEWVFSPSRAPHFGGLWEAAVKSMKTLLCKVVGGHELYQHELDTILIEIEGTLNSRPLAIVPGSAEEGVSALTAGHFLIGRPIHAPPVEVDSDSKISSLTSWDLVKRLTAEIWVRWRKEYLQTLQRLAKWRRPTEDFKPGDIVILKESDWWQRSWPLARIERVHPGSDSHVRVANIFMKGKSYRCPITKLVLMVEEQENDAKVSSSSGPPVCVQAT